MELRSFLGAASPSVKVVCSVLYSYMSYRRLVNDGGQVTLQALKVSQTK